MLETRIGLEVHVELMTKLKMFCACPNQFGAAPNEDTCPICIGLSETLPVLNQDAVRLAMRAGRALHCNICRVSSFDRKSYVSPDLPKGYQITQYHQPLCQNGYLDIHIPSSKQIKRIRLARIHLEEDAGKTVYLEGQSEAFVDFNRAGIPLIEVVTQPELTTPEEVIAFLKELKLILEYTSVSDGRMEQGSLRCDVNLSVRRVGARELGAKVELKNLNSFKEIQKALVWEEKRQQKLLKLGRLDEIIQETRKWDDKKGVTIPMRLKGGASDYQILPEPDLPPLDLSNWADTFIAESLPELPEQKRNRFLSQYGLSMYEINILTESRLLADYFEEVVKYGIQPREASNWILTEILRLWKNTADQTMPVDSRRLADLIKMVNKGKVSRNIGKEILSELVVVNKTPQDIVKQKGLVQISDRAEIEGLIQNILNENQDAVEDFKEGKIKAMGFLMGQIMKAGQGKLNPIMAKEILEKYLSQLQRTGALHSNFDENKI